MTLFHLTQTEEKLLDPFLHIPPYSIVAYNNVAWRIEQSEFYASWNTKPRKAAYDHLLQRGSIHEIYHGFNGAKFTIDDSLLSLFGFENKQECIAYILHKEIAQEVDHKRWDSTFYGSIERAQVGAIRSLREFYRHYGYTDIPQDDVSLWIDHNSRAHDCHVTREEYLQSLERLAALHHV